MTRIVVKMMHVIAEHFIFAHNRQQYCEEVNCVEIAKALYYFIFSATLFLPIWRKLTIKWQNGKHATHTNQMK